MFILWSRKKRCYGNQLIVGEAFADIYIDRVYFVLWRSHNE